MPEVSFQMSGRDLNEPLQESALRAAFLGLLPKTFPCLMGFPPVAIVIKIDAEQIIGGVRPALGRYPRLCRRMLTGGMIAVTLGMCHRMRMQAGDIAVGREWFLAISRRRITRRRNLA